MSRMPGGDAARLQALSRVDPLLPDEAYWLVGFLEAEAHFYIQPNNGGANWICGVRLGIRDDDADVLLALWNRTALGRVRPVAARRTSRPQACWQIDSKIETARMASLLTDCPPVGRRRHEVKEWVAAVNLLADRRLGCSDHVWREVAVRAEQIRGLRKFAQHPARAAFEMDDALFLAWLGGFFTGEGCLMLDERRPRPGSPSQGGRSAPARSTPSAAWNRRDLRPPRLSNERAREQLDRLITR